jgi:hypothetical protein
MDDITSTQQPSFSEWSMRSSSSLPEQRTANYPPTGSVDDPSDDDEPPQAKKKKKKRANTGGGLGLGKGGIGDGVDGLRRRDGMDGEEGTAPSVVDVSPLTALLNGITSSEHLRALYDLHGVPDLPDEDPERMEEWIEEMWMEHLPKFAQSHPGLALAMQMDPRYVRGERLKFLRADWSYDRERASEAMGIYFDMRLKYFGEGKQQDGVMSRSCECLARDLTLHDDFTEGELELIKAGFFQLCEERDRSGRVVTAVFPQAGLRLGIPAATVVKFFMYLTQILTRDESVQRLGRVHICWCLGLMEDKRLMENFQNLYFEKQYMDSILFCDRYLPLRCVAKHYCLDDQSLQGLVDRWTVPMVTFNAARVRAHYGSYTECAKELMTVGISTESLPFFTENGDVDVDFHLGVLEALLKLEEGKRLKGNRDESNLSGGDVASADTTSSPDHLVFPGPIDVIMGKGRHNQLNPGNLRFKLLLEEYQDEYEHATIPQRRTIIDRVLQKLKDAGSRFLYQCDGSTDQPIEPLTKAKDTTRSKGGGTIRQWIEVSAVKARDKVSHDFRNLQRTRQLKEKRGRSP